MNTFCILFDVHNKNDCLNELHGAYLFHLDSAGRNNGITNEYAIAYPSKACINPYAANEALPARRQRWRSQPFADPLNALQPAGRSRDRAADGRSGPVRKMVWARSPLVHLIVRHRSNQSRITYFRRE